MDEIEVREVAFLSAAIAFILSYLLTGLATVVGLVKPEFEGALAVWKRAGWALHAAFGSGLSASTPDGQPRPPQPDVRMESLFSATGDLEVTIIVCLFLCSVAGVYYLRRRVTLFSGLLYTFFFSMLYGGMVWASALVIGESVNILGTVLRYSPSGEAGVTAGITAVFVSFGAVVSSWLWDQIVNSVRTTASKILE